MQPSDIIQLLQNGIQLKQMPRTGWLQRGVPHAETVAAHSYGVALTVMVLSSLVEEPLDEARVLKLAILHDLPEAKTSDIPSPVKRFMPADVRKTMKSTIERNALLEMVENSAQRDEWLALWDELVANNSAESKMVHDADKLDMYLQASTYEQQSGNQQLAEFWQTAATFHFPQAQAIYDELRQRRGLTAE